MLFNFPELVQTLGYIGLFGIIFAETGLLIGFFLPGDSLLFAAGILASQGHLNIYLLVILLLAAAIVGNGVGYWLGRRLGPRVFSRPNSLFFNQANVDRAQIFFDTHGWKTLIIGRFVPVIRTFIPVMAGVGKMSFPKFMLHNIIGGALWIGLVTLLGYWLGQKVSNIEAYIIPGVAVIILLSLAPYIKHFITTKSTRDHTRRVIKNIFSRKRNG